VTFIHLLMLSAQTPECLEKTTDDAASLLERDPAIDLAAFAQALRTGPPAYQHRRVLVAADGNPAEAAMHLRKRTQRRVFTDIARPGRPIVFMFPGVGDQYQGMAAGVYRHLPIFREELDRCFGMLRDEIGINLYDLLKLAEGRGGPRSQPDLVALFDQRAMITAIHETLVAQPLLFAIQYAMARSLLAAGIKPSAMVGYSVGEYVAACLAGVLPVEGALRLVALRARLISDLPEGAMLAVMSPAPPLDPYLGSQVSLAAVDGPELTVLAGPVEAIERVGSMLLSNGVGCRRLAVSHAFHSAMMEPAVRAIRDAAADLTLRPPSIPFLSNVTGTWIEEAEATSPDYWARHLRQTIRFDDNLAELWKLDRPLLVEVGPGQALGKLAIRSPAKPAGEAPAVLRTLPGLFESDSDLGLLLTTVGRLWAAGTDIDWRPEGDWGELWRK
jgi:acyl transferase domain-containing protein